MKITGEELFFLIQVLKDSLDIQMGYDWSFHSKREQRQEFYNKLMQTILYQQSVDIKEINLSKLQINKS